MAKLVAISTLGNPPRPSEHAVLLVAGSSLRRPPFLL
jgi:hypothetical protein